MIKGTHVAAKFTPSTVIRLRAFMKIMDIPNRVRSANLHSTITYSRTPCPDIMEQEFGYIPKAIPKCFEIWPVNGKNYLVLVLNSPTQSVLHEQNICDFGATHEFDDYTPHVTLSYDVGDFDITKLNENISNIGEIVLSHTEVKELI